jgi:hypothetical protein
MGLVQVVYQATGLGLDVALQRQPSLEEEGRVVVVFADEGTTYCVGGKLAGWARDKDCWRGAMPSTKRQTWIAWLCASVMPPLGVAVGVYVAMASFRTQVAAIRAESPDAEICGNPAIPGLFLGFVGGALGGIIAGGVVAHLVTRLMSSRFPEHDALTSSSEPIAENRE